MMNMSTADFVCIAYKDLHKPTLTIHLLFSHSRLLRNNITEVHRITVWIF